MIRKSLLFTLILFHFSLHIHAQTVGLVLSGGGAKGLAHIGVIRVLEENNIPIDYIAGTSIGAIVGGLYAAGYTTDQMEELFKSEDFYFWSTGKIQKEYRYFFKQRELDPSWLEFRLAKKEDKVKLLPPTNFISEKQMDFAFMELVASSNTACNNNFDSLMVPFLCVATDINSGKPVILRKGDLGEAIRASMTIPFYFKPIEIDGKLLFDGGIVNNFPHDIMKEKFKPDIIIGHKVANDIKNVDPDNVMQQISKLVMRPTNFEIDPKDGILLETKLEDVSLLDFDKIETILAAGTKTAEQMIDSIKRRITRRQTQLITAQKREKFNAKKPELLFQNIQVEGVTDPMQRKFIIQSIKHKYDVITLSSLKKEYFKLIADDHIKSIRPISRYNRETGYYDLHLIVKPENKVEINIGGNISTKPINQGFASINYRTYKSRAYTLTSNIYFGRFYSSFKIGGRIDYPSKLPFYLSGYSTFNRWDFFSSSSELFFEDVHPPYIIQNEMNHRIEAGFPLGIHGKLFVETAYTSSTDEYYQMEIFKKGDVPDKTSFKAFVAHVGIENNSLNNKQFATEGSYHFLSAKYVSGDESNLPGTTSNFITKPDIKHNYFLLEAHSRKYYKLGKFFTIGTLAEAVFSNKELFQNYRGTMLTAPSFNPTPHSKSLFIENFRANNYLSGGLSALFHLNPSMHLRVEGYGFVPVKQVMKHSDFTPYINAKTIGNYYLQGMAAMVYQTGVGPVSLSVNYYDKENSKFYVTLNFGYILFNKRGL
ncbi:MAG: patatin-like phospholipase family protein [Draconibacterium sp.]|nr:patatin-like phospholipase family protein [Draconibacterium sp.]